MKQSISFVKVNDISKHLNCPICYEIFLNPSRVLCGHTYCLDCAKKLKQCALCRFEITNKNMIQKDIIAEKIINDLEVFCFNKYNCNWRGSLEQLKKHSKNCLFGKKDVPEWFKAIQETEKVQVQNIDKEILNNEDFQQKCNELVPQGNLMQRLYNQKKDLTLQNDLNRNQKTNYLFEDQFLDNLLNETTNNDNQLTQMNDQIEQQNIELNSNQQNNDFLVDFQDKQMIENQKEILRKIQTEQKKKQKEQNQSQHSLVKKLKQQE